jgi:DNA-binding NarL/FixJ family response regulator
MQKPPVRILVVDDAEAFRRAAALVIDVSDGFELVGEAVSGQDAIDMVPRVRPDLVLMDVNMPGVDGVEAAAVLRHRHDHVCVVLLSAHTFPDIDPASPAAAVARRPKEAFGPDELARLWRGCAAARPGRGT